MFFFYFLLWINKWLNFFYFLYKSFNFFFYSTLGPHETRVMSKCAKPDLWFCVFQSAALTQDWKQRCLERLFHMLMFTQVRRAGSYLSNLSDSSILSMTVKHVRVLSLNTSSKNICRLASGDLRPILSALEAGVTSLRLLDANALFKHGRKYVLFILHRLLDHGSVREVVLRRNPDSSFLRWLMSRHRGPQGSSETSHADGHCSVEHDGELEEPAAKRLALDVEGNPKVFCSEFSSFSSPADHCPEGHIQSLDFEVSKCEILTTVSHILPTWSSLHTLHLHSDCKYMLILKYDI